MIETMDGIVAIAILSIAAGGVVMLLGVAAKRSLEAKRVLYNPLQGLNGFGANSGAGTTAFRAAPNATDAQDAVSAGKPLL